MEDFNSLLSETVSDDSGADKAGTRLGQFAQANASLAIEGLHVSDEDKAIQDQIARGKLTHDEGVAQYMKAFGVR